MKLLILLSFCAIFICFSVNSAEKEQKIKKNEQFRVKFGFWAANEPKYADKLKDTLLSGSKSKLEEMKSDKEIQYIQGDDKIKIERVFDKIAYPYLEFRITRKGKRIGKAYTFVTFVEQFCDPIR